MDCSCGRKYGVFAAPSDSTHDGSEEHVLVLPEPSALTAFQVRVLQLIARGMTDGEAAQELHVSVHVVRHAVRELITRLAAHNRAEAVFIAAKRGFLVTAN